MKDFIYTLLLFIYSFFNPDLYDSTPPAIDIDNQRFSVLVFSKTQASAYRHKSIPQGREALKQIAEENGWSIFLTENGAVFNETDLNKFDTVVFLSTSGNILSISQKRALKEYITNGGGFLGVHSASDTEHRWSWYKSAMAGMYNNHVPPKAATLNKEIEHPTVKALPSNWEVTDEWYNYSPNPRENAEVLVSLDATDLKGIGDAQPVIWYQLLEKGRFYYTGLGHRPEMFDEVIFRQHLSAAIAWTGKQKPPGPANRQ